MLWLLIDDEIISPFQMFLSICLHHFPFMTRHFCFYFSVFRERMLYFLIKEEIILLFIYIFTFVFIIFSFMTSHFCFYFSVFPREIAVVIDRRRDHFFFSNTSFQLPSPFFLIFFRRRYVLLNICNVSQWAMSGSFLTSTTFFAV